MLRSGSSALQSFQSRSLAASTGPTMKHAFPHDQSDAQITVAYDAAGTNWKLSVADNGIGKPEGLFAQAKIGLGTSIVNANCGLFVRDRETSVRIGLCGGPGRSGTNQRYQ
jgi:hypothetical protein